MWTRDQIKTNGKIAFKANYWMCVLVSLILAILAGGSSLNFNFNINIEDGQSIVDLLNISDFIAGFAGITGLIAIVVSIFICGPFEIGGNRFFMENRFGKVGIEKIGYAFTSGNYGNCVVVMFFKGLFTLLWSLLLVVPGIVKSYEYRMIPYILSENPGINRQRAFDISKQMMNGQKMDVFILDLSFIGWYIVAACTCGIAGIFYVAPYINATNAELYTALRTQALGTGIVSTNELPGYGTQYF